jgi:hypothetical protein
VGRAARRARRGLFVAALAAAVPGGAARAQDTTIPVAAASRGAAALDSLTRDSLDALVAEARRRGLPAEPLYTKALEGVEKGADGARIRVAVRAMFGRLEAARAALAPAVSGAELVAGADALALGVPSTTLHQLRELFPGRSTAVPLGVLAQLVSRGVPVKQAEAAVFGLLRRGGGSQQLLVLEHSVTDDINLGMTPDAALELRSKAMILALPAASAAGGVNTEALSTQSGGNKARGGKP